MAEKGLTCYPATVRRLGWIAAFAIGCAEPPSGTGATPVGPAAAPTAPTAAPATPGAPDALEARRKALSDDLREMVAELQTAGRYDCCIKSPCKLCAMRAGGCRCGENARAHTPVCEECAEMWMHGQGDEPVEKSSIHSFLEAERLAAGDYGDICGLRDRKPGGP